MPSTSTDRIDGLTTSVAIKAPCRVATTANITLSGLQTIDGVTVVAGDRVLVKNQTAAAENGIWVVSSTAWSRARDFNGARDAIKGTLVAVYSGTENAQSIWQLNSGDPVYIGTTELSFVLANDVNFSEALAASSGSSLVGFLSSATSAIATTVYAWLNDWAVVKNFVTGDGSADDQAGLAAAVAYAYSTGKPLYWNGQTCLTTATIPNFHDVEHVGRGSVVRGSDTFYIRPKLAQTNTLYVDPAGDNTNDGLTASQPLATVQKACDILAEFAPRLPGRWVIQLAAGTYTENVLFDSATASEYPIYIKGPDVTHPTVPTAIIAASSASDNVFTCDVGGWFVLVNIKLQDATSTYAVQTNGSRLTLNNVHIANSISGVQAQNAAVVAAIGGIWTGRGSGVAGGIGYAGFFNVMHDIGGTSAVNATQITAFERGLLVNEGTQGHLDYTQVSNCVTGLNIKRGAGACNTDDMSITGCTTGVLVENNGWFNNNITFSGNTYNVAALGDSPELSYLTVTNEGRTNRQVQSTNFASHTGTTTETTIWTSETVPSWALSKAGPTMKVRIFGTCSLAGGTATVRIKVNNGADVTFGTVIIPSGSTTFDLECTMSYTGGANFRTLSRVLTDTNVTPAYATPSATVKDTAFTVKATAQLANAGDSILFAKLFFEGSHGG